MPFWTGILTWALTKDEMKTFTHLNNISEAYFDQTKNYQMKGRKMSTSQFVCLKRRSDSKHTFGNFQTDQL